MSEEERTPPTKIRVTKLQEAQLLDLEKIELRVATMLGEAGFTEAQAAPLGEVDIAKLTRQSDVLVAEADDVVAGYLVWADEAPGVAHMMRLMVDPDLQRFGIGTRLLRELGEAARGHRLEAVVTAVWDRATGAMAFLGVRGFAPVDAGGTTATVGGWEAGATVSDGQQHWWAKTDGLGTVPGLPRPS